VADAHDGWGKFAIVHSAEIARLRQGASRISMPDTNDLESYLAKREPFGRWLLSQRDRGVWVGDLASTARADRTILKDADPEAVRSHLRKQQADGDVIQAVDDAEAVPQSLTG
jgi:hypothetical protein